MSLNFQCGWLCRSSLGAFSFCGAEGLGFGAEGLEVMAQGGRRTVQINPRVTRDVKRFQTGLLYGFQRLEVYFLSPPNIPSRFLNMGVPPGTQRYLGYTDKSQRFV